MIIITPDQMREIEKIAETEFGLTSEILIERAANAIIQELEADFGNQYGLRIFFAVGPGNNGKDALKVAEMLGMDPNKYSIEQAEVVIDGLYGTGLNRDISTADSELIEAINASGLPVYSIDIPSGINGLTGQIQGNAIKACKTVSFFGAKPGLLFGPGKDCAGELVINDIDIPISKSISSHITLQSTHLDKKIFKRPQDSHKGTFGKVLVIAGSDGMRGAAAFCTNAAFAAGAGLVYVATPSKVWDTVSVLAPAAIGIAKEDIYLMAGEVAAIIVGPGMGAGPVTREIVLKLLREFKTPLILDADALNSIKAADITREVIITPHLVEFERLAEVARGEILNDRLGFVSDFSRKHSCVAILKGAGTVVASSTGQLSINTNGNPGMAVAGSGDVLAGIIAGLAAQGLNLYEAACGGVFLHGLAGDFAAKKHGELSLLPSDIVKCISDACLSLKG